VKPEVLLRPGRWFNHKHDSALALIYIRKFCHALQVLAKKNGRSADNPIVIRS
jgi:hypothetical protein